MYIAPETEINETMVCQMMALSLQSGMADDSEALGKGEAEWDMWDSQSEIQ